MVILNPVLDTMTTRMDIVITRMDILAIAQAAAPLAYNTGDWLGYGSADSENYSNEVRQTRTPSRVDFNLR